ncbi:MAG: hypothetical protein US86_C0001G0072 [Candidatus Daviesbacteria bacterium GW2011_GWA2_38_24]|uniref:Uncharacterized protein n=1 Tax=Candidatus Daviesbacteria bacterium GW2011_GWA2_38_24 TaxID=1618422 RepID=A0A0G0JVP2_9BACT|nr:MAG: hypothetical protein US86_C0001G0072 [Candidatus Daviesbacteria bacterium GW2011_GWA2_38_24]OGE23507.1 MAG: hypothetical protein A2688_03380 [Candidatus Daviesbacteria bacterium RIFCSPHIGHO2_01_FULL_38_8]
MTDDELNKFRAIVKEEIVSSERRIRVDVKEEIVGSEERIRGEIKEEIVGSEQRFRTTLKDELILSEKRILNEIGEFVESQLLPIIDDKADKSDIDRIERKLDRFGDKITDHDKRLSDIESLPSIAHELRRKKK